MTTAKRCLVTGKVQGVWFRGSAQREAQRLGITGWARNLADGSVEVIACGEAAAIAVLVEWLHRGPDTARVDRVMVEDWPGEPPETFRIE